MSARIAWRKTAVFMAILFATPSAIAQEIADSATSRPDVTSNLPVYTYALSGGDRVRVVVFGDQTLGGEFMIDGSGFISLPLIGDVDVRGLTANQLQHRIVTRLADGYVKDPRVTVEVLTTRPFYILGEVNKPGQYPYVNGMTVLGAVAQAGGYTYRAKTRQVLIKHAGEDIEASHRVTAKTLIAPGDTIRIKERWF